MSCCAHPDCRREVEPRYIACRSHWFALPRELRARLWAAYGAGIEIDRDPPRAWVDALEACRSFWASSPARGTVAAAREGARVLLSRLA